jgi:hypothetical protein
MPEQEVADQVIPLLEGALDNLREARWLADQSQDADLKAKLESLWLPMSNAGGILSAIWETFPGLAYDHRPDPQPGSALPQSTDHDAIVAQRVRVALQGAVRFLADASSRLQGAASSADLRLLARLGESLSTLRTVIDGLVER